MRSNCVPFTSQLSFITMFSIFATRSGCRSFPRNYFMFDRRKINFLNVFRGKTVKLAFKTPSRCITPRYSRLNINPKVAVLPFLLCRLIREQDTKNIPNCSSASTFCHSSYNFFLASQDSSGAVRRQAFDKKIWASVVWLTSRLDDFPFSKHYSKLTRSFTFSNRERWKSEK